MTIEVLEYVQCYLTGRIIQAHRLLLQPDLLPKTIHESFLQPGGASSHRAFLVAPRSTTCSSILYQCVHRPHTSSAAISGLHADIRRRGVVLYFSSHCSRYDTFARSTSIYVSSLESSGCRSASCCSEAAVILPEILAISFLAISPASSTSVATAVSLMSSFSSLELLDPLSSTCTLV